MGNFWPRGRVTPALAETSQNLLTSCVPPKNNNFKKGYSATVCVVNTIDQILVKSVICNLYFFTGPFGLVLQKMYGFYWYWRTYFLPVADQIRYNIFFWANNKNSFHVILSQIHSVLQCTALLVSDLSIQPIPWWPWWDKGIRWGDLCLVLLVYPQNGAGQFWHNNKKRKCMLSVNCLFSQLYI